MNILEGCSGHEGWSKIWRKNGHQVTTIDIEPIFKPDICMDILDYQPDQVFDVMFFSPPCIFFSKIRNVWNNTPLATTSKDLEHAISIAKKCFDLIKENKPKYYLVENPTGGMSNHFSKGYVTIDYCEYNYYSDYWSKNWKQFLRIKKSTDLWTNINFKKLRCSGNHPHIELIEALRKSSDRAKIPYGLSKTIYEFIINQEGLKK